MKTSIVLASAMAGVACVALSGLAAGEARACAAAAPPGVVIEVADESALIVWDAAQKVEHFIRQARFDARGEAADFGFLVPTPTKPELAEASPQVFAALERAVAPEAVWVESWWPLKPQLLCTASLSATRGGAEGPASVQVLDEVQVAGYEAAILASTDAGALAEWLRHHGYDERPSLKGWLERYVAQRWIITAFKVTGRATAPVRMSFSAERPFYPYREPDDARGDEARARPRSLRVFLFSRERMAGTIGEATAWPGSLDYASPVDRVVARHLIGSNVPGLPSGALLWLHGFKDVSSPRPGTDEVFFARDATQVEQTPPPIERGRGTVVPLEPLMALGVIAVFVVRARRRAAAAAAPKKGEGQ